MLVQFGGLLFAAIATTVGPVGPAAQPTAVGHWEGTMYRGASQLSVRFDFSQGSPSQGTFSAPDLGAIEVPLSGVKLGRVLHWQLVGDATTTTFDATINGDTMTGTFKEQSTCPGALTLRRASGLVAEPYATEPIAFTNGTVHLAGTIFVPRSAAKHAGVVLVQGSGPEGRWANAYIADYLARHGVVALTFDKRGVGASTGDWRAATMEDLAGDARAAVHLLAQRGEVDHDRVGVYGHSQGGQLVPAIAVGDSDVRWIIDADGPVGPQYRQDLFRVDTMLAKSFSGESLVAAEKLYAEFVNVARNDSSHADLRANVEKAKGAPWLDSLAIPSDTSWIWAWYRLVGNYDNSSAWGNVKVPVLVLFGADDELVPPEESIAETVRILKDHGNRAFAVRVFPGADHTLHVPAGEPGGWPHVVPGFFEAVTSFAQSAGAASSR